MVGCLILFLGLHNLITKNLNLDDSKISAGLLAAFSAVAVWCYQSASVRLGAVDLFACEIATICRVITVTETASHLSDCTTAHHPRRQLN